MARQQKDFSDFMVKKTKESIGEALVDDDEKEEGLKNAPKTINKEAGVDDTRAIKALSTLRYILRMLFIIPLLVAIIVLVSFVLLKIVPSAFYFVKKLIISILTTR